MANQHVYSNNRKCLFSIEVTPYHPNRQLSIINSNGGLPRHHFPTNGSKGVLVVMIDFDDINELQREYDWIKDVHKGYYDVLNELNA